MAAVKGLDFEKLVCEVLFQGVTANLPSSFYVGIGSGLLPAKDATLATVAAAEVSGPGYARIQLQRNSTDFPTLALAAGDWKVSSKLLHWIASGDWTGSCDFIFITDAASGTSGRFFGAAGVDVPFQIFGGDTFDDTLEYTDK